MKVISVSTLLLAGHFLTVPDVHSELLPSWGRVTLNGSIVDSACAIDTGSYDQSVDLGVLPLAALQQQGLGPVQPFSIALIGCTFAPYEGSEWQSFSVTFEGTASGDWFTVSGEARGIALLLQNMDGKTIYPGKSEPRQAIVPGNSVLQYGLRLVSNEHPLRPGHYQTAIRFKLDYY